MTLLEPNTIHNIDCMKTLPEIPDKSVDMILSDLPYGILKCQWDKKLPLDEYFAECNRIIKDNGAILLTATLKFAVELINANKKYFRYDWIYEKTLAGGFANSHKMPLRAHEHVLVFYKKLPVYNPQGLVEVEHLKIQKRKPQAGREYAYQISTQHRESFQKFTGYPRSVVKFSNKNNFSVHPTQKPLELFKYLVLTYTNAGDLVLDTCMGSGTTAVACVETGRRFIGFETDERYCEIGRQRVLETQGRLDALPSVASLFMETEP